MQHFTRNTVASEAWCPRCRKPTMHRVDGVKLGPCLECIKRAEILHEAFEERAAIKEFCGNMPREMAEREARREVFGTETPLTVTQGKLL